jgi:hypothetical protein
MWSAGSSAREPAEIGGGSTAPMIVSTAPQTSRKASNPRSAHHDSFLGRWRSERALHQSADQRHPRTKNHVRVLFILSMTSWRSAVANQMRSK